MLLLVNHKGYGLSHILDKIIAEFMKQRLSKEQAKQYAKWLSQANKIPPQAPDELYRAYDKAKKYLKPKNKEQNGI